MRPTTLKRAFLLLALLGIGCGGGGREDPILRLSAEEALEQGKALMAQEKFAKAGPLLIHAFEVEPNSRSGREALLLAADALYLRGGSDSYIKCEAKYRDFLNRFPTSERADYAQFQVANCLAERVRKPDRDQKVTHQALQSYQELMRLYPTSPYAAEARTKIEAVNDRLAEHEMAIGHFYRRFRICEATIQRLEYLREEYPNYNAMDRAVFTLGLAYDACARFDDAEEMYETLHQRYPDSPYILKLDKQRKKVAKHRDKLIKRAQRRRGRFQPARPQETEGETEGEAGSGQEETDSTAEGEGGR